jgi:hypothetical protein
MVLLAVSLTTWFGCSFTLAGEHETGIPEAPHPRKETRRTASSSNGPRSSGDTVLQRNGGIPDVISEAARSTLRVFYCDDGWCSATRVSDDLVLTAAHCFLGIEGGKPPETITTATAELGDRRVPLELVEAGRYDLGEGNTQDWVLFTPTEGSEALDDVGIAEFPDAAEMAGLLGGLGEFSELRSGPAVWALTFPQMPLYRTLPRPSFVDIGSRFVSRGFIRSDTAYRRSLLYYLQTGHALDDQYGSAVPSFEVDIPSAWAKLPSMEDNPGARGAHILFDLYEEDEDPVLYHSAEINGGSSGGGAFVETTGHLLGLICTQAGPANPGDTFLPTQALYRIDRICAQSAALSRLGKCKQLLPGADSSKRNPSHTESTP